MAGKFTTYKRLLEARGVRKTFELDDEDDSIDVKLSSKRLKKTSTDLFEQDLERATFGTILYYSKKDDMFSLRKFDPTYKSIAVCIGSYLNGDPSFAVKELDYSNVALPKRFYTNQSYENAAYLDFIDFKEGDPNYENKEFDNKTLQDFDGIENTQFILNNADAYKYFFGNNRDALYYIKNYYAYIPAVSELYYIVKKSPDDSLKVSTSTFCENGLGSFNDSGTFEPRVRSGNSAGYIILINYRKRMPKSYAVKQSPYETSSTYGNISFDYNITM